jgi:hypothetical protein
MVRSKIGRWECMKCKPAHSCKLCKLQSGTHDLDPKTTERGGAILHNTLSGLTHSSRFIRHRCSTAASEIPTCLTPLPLESLPVAPEAPACRPSSCSRGWGRKLLPDRWGGLAGAEEEGSPARAQFTRGSCSKGTMELPPALYGAMNICNGGTWRHSW